MPAIVCLEQIDNEPWPTEEEQTGNATHTRLSGTQGTANNVRGLWLSLFHESPHSRNGPIRAFAIALRTIVIHMNEPRVRPYLFEE